MSEESSTYFRTNNILTIDIDNCNCTFEYLGSVSTSKGAALYIDDSNLTISEVTFTHNKAVYGAAIELDCLTSLKCSYTIANCTFENNTATSRGGAIRYNLYRPTFENNTYIGNSAAYGPNIASYAIKVIQQNSTSDSVILDNVGSGIQYDGSMVLQLVDHDNQVMILDSSSQISIQAKSSNQSVTGTTTKKIVKGIATFDELIFESYPGDTNIEFKITSSALKQNVLELQYGVNFSQAPITVNFRYCQPGEIIQDQKICVECSPNTYSFTWNSTKCNTCMDNAVCLGGTEINAQEGYWRINKNATVLFDCLRPKACLGGFIDNSKHPVN